MAGASVGRAIAALLVLSAVQWAAADDQAAAGRLFQRMDEALRSLDFEGTLVYLSDNRMETLHIVHWIETGRVQERMVSLSGPVQAVSREPDRVTCVLAGGHPISVNRHRGGNLLHAPIVPDAIAARYQVELLGRARVAGRDTDVIAIRPRDDLRYGFQLQLDSATGLPLKSDVIDEDGEPIEQLMFTSLELADSAPDEDAADTKVPIQDVRVARAQAVDRPTRCRFDRVPSGFVQIMGEVLAGPGRAEMEHFVFSDGLSAYSVYVEPGVDDGLLGVSRIGAIHAAGLRVDGHQVTAVGEVPAATVQAAVKGLRLAPAAPVETSQVTGARE